MSVKSKLVYTSEVSDVGPGQAKKLHIEADIEFDNEAGTGSVKTTVVDDFGTYHEVEGIESELLDALNYVMMHGIGTKARSSYNSVKSTVEKLTH